VALFPRREVDVEDKIKEVLRKFVNQRFNDVTITAIKAQYDVDGRRADIAVLKDDGKPILIIETKKKYEARGFRVERRFIPISEEVVGQAVAYAALLKRGGIHVPFVATANESHLALFKVPDDVEQIVDWSAIEGREYGRVLRDFYRFVDQNRIFYKPHNFSEEFFKELLDTVTGLYKERYNVEEKRQELHWTLLENLRGFVDFIAPFIREAIAPGGRFRNDISGMLEEYGRRVGYTPTPEGLAREMAYALMNKIVFYKVLERYYGLQELEPLYEKGIATTCNTYLRKLNELFEDAVIKSRDFEAIFRTGIYDAVDIVESEEVLKVFDGLIKLLNHYRIERFGDIVGFIYEELIPGEERHRLGQFYTPKPIAELIVRWCVRSPDDRVLDPGCGSGTFLVEAYKRLAELKLRRPYRDIKHVPEDVHRQILRQLYGVDVNEFPAHLTAMNLAMKNVRVPSVEINVIREDFFAVQPNQVVQMPYSIRTPEGEKQAEIVFKDFDVVVGNPPYTRWTEIPEITRKRILKQYEMVLRDYGLHKFITGGAIPGIYIPWIIHSTKFLKEGGRLGMIISDSWLQTEYGVGFLRYLIDNFKVDAIIDVSPRVFATPLIGACIVLLERCSESSLRDSNTTVLMYIVAEGKTPSVNMILNVIENAKKGVHVKSNGYSINVVKQSELKHVTFKPITLFFNVEDIINSMESSVKVVKLGEVFQVSEGNTIWSIYASMKGKGAGVGGEDFYYLTEDKVRQYGLNKYVGIYLKPLISSPDKLKYFTFTEEDWSREREYMLVANAPYVRLPPEVQAYIKLGETSITLTKGKSKGKPVSQSAVAKIRRSLGEVEVLGRSIRIYDWYDLGGVVEAPIYATRGSRYWMRFVLAKLRCALDDRVLALILRQGAEFTETELKALLAYLNSSFTQLQAEVRGRVAGGVALLEFDVRPLSEFLILDVKKLPREVIEKLAQLFDRLEAEARKLGGADEVEVVFGSELARELAGGGDVRPGVPGLFNTVIKDIDYEVARILGLEHVVEAVRALVLDMARRRLARAREARREAIRGSEEIPRIEKPKRRRSGGGRRGIHRSLDEFT